MSTISLSRVYAHISVKASPFKNFHRRINVNAFNERERRRERGELGAKSEIPSKTPFTVISEIVNIAI